MIPGKNGQESMFKWLSLKSNRSLDRRPWQQWEDTFLRNSVIQKNSKHWLKISKDLYNLHENSDKIYRTAKQCRERWACYVNPVLKKGQWSIQQDILLLSKYLQVGKKWSIVAKLLKGRTQNAVKNRWKLLASKYKGRKCDMDLNQYLTNHKEMLELSIQNNTQAIKKQHTFDQYLKSSLSATSAYEYDSYDLNLREQNVLNREIIEGNNQDIEKNQGINNIIYRTYLQNSNIISQGQNLGRIDIGPLIDHYLYTEDDLNQIAYKHYLLNPTNE